MRLFDPHIHMTSRTTDDYRAMADAGIRAVIEPAFWVGQPRTHVGTFEDYFLSLIGWERFRAAQFGVRHYCTLALNPKEANNPAVAEGVMALLPAYLEKDGVVAVGEIGYDDQTEAEEHFFRAQLELAREADLPVLIHTPHRDKKRGTERSLALVRETGFPPERTLVDHNTEETLPLVLDAGCWAGHSIYPETKMDEARMVALVKRYGPERILVNSAADWGVSDPLKVPKTARAMRRAGIPARHLELVFWENPVRFFGQSGRLEADMAAGVLPVDQRRLWEGSSVLRGQAPRVDGQKTVARPKAKAAPSSRPRAGTKVPSGSRRSRHRP
jgi:predicted metal-dependent TIM-barrel fold hydrolase